jgi:hypothetical protein
MTFMTMKRFLLSAIMAAALMGQVTQAQLVPKNIAAGTTPEEMVQTLLAGGISVSNIKYTGSTNAAGVFCGGKDLIGFEGGIILTSGDTANSIGPNNSSGQGLDNNQPGDPDLDSLIPGYQTFDACILEFDFVPVADTARFEYVFASEEFNEFVNTSFNDVFGFFVNGVNYALLPGTATPVSINNVNNGTSGGQSAGPCMNCQFFIDNASGILNLQYDGLTTVLTMTANVLPGQSNKMKIGVADAGDGILDSAVFIKAFSFQSGSSADCITRNTRYWFTHPDDPANPGNPNAATLRNAMIRALSAACATLDLGFITLPTQYWNQDNVKNGEDAVWDAMGLYWKNKDRTGERSGMQDQKQRGSALCRARKVLSQELLAAIANVAVLGTDPSRCTYPVNVNGQTVLTNFPPDLLEQAQFVNSREGTKDILAMRKLLKAFNQSGALNNFSQGYYEVSEDIPKSKQIARDPTTQANCPGFNDNCFAAMAITEFPFKKTVDLTKYTDTIDDPLCGVGGREVVYKLPSYVAVAGRPFRVDTFGSNFDTLVSIWSGSCGTNALAVVECNNDYDGLTKQSKVSFTTPGDIDYYIVVEGANGAYGNLKVQVQSP